MYPAAGQLPDEPGVDGAEKELARVCALSRAGDVVEQPLYFRTGEVCVRLKSGFMADGVAIAARDELVNDVGGASALPDDGVCDRLSRLFIPDDGSFTLVCYADGGDCVRPHAELCHGSAGDFERGVPYLVRVMLHPARLGIDLPEFLLCRGADISRLVEQDTS